MTNGNRVHLINLPFFLLSITANYYFQLLYYCLYFLALVQYNFAVGVKDKEGSSGEAVKLRWYHFNSTTIVEGKKEKKPKKYI